MMSSSHLFTNLTCLHKIICSFSFLLAIVVLLYIWPYFGVVHLVINIWFAYAILARECYILLGVFGRCLRIVFIIFLIYQISNLFLWTFQKSVYLALSMLLNWIVSSLNSWGIYRNMSSRALVSLQTSRYNYSWLRAWWARTWRPNFSLISFLSLFHIFALNNIIFNIFVLVLCSSPLWITFHRDFQLF